jgi:hypothetical protein
MEKLTKAIIYQCTKNPKIINWAGLSRNYNLSENFMREFQDMVYWSYISKYQKTLSEDFLIEFLDRIEIRWLEGNDNVPKDVIGRVKLLKVVL